MKRKNVIKILILSLSLVFLLSACKDEIKINTPVSKYKAINITVQARDIMPFVTIKASAYGLLPDGSQELISSGLKWSSSDPQVATVDATGLITAVSHGVALITSSDGVITSNKHKIVVSSTPIFRLDITQGPRNDQNVLRHAIFGDKVQLYAVATLKNGRQLDVSSVVDWSSAEPKVASVDQNGLLKVTSKTESFAKIVARYPRSKIINGQTIIGESYTVAGKFKVSVTPKPAGLTSEIHIFGVKTMHQDISHQLNSSLLYNSPGKINQLAMDVTHTSIWTSSNPALASVDKNTGVVTGHKAGKVTITDSYSITGIQKPVTSAYDIEITDQKIIGIELQETYTKKGDGTVLSEQSKTIPVLQSGYFGTPPPSALLMTLYVVYAGGGKEYVPVGASWLSSNQSAAYIAASASGDYVYGLKTADNVKITASFKGFKTSFVVNVSEDQAPKLLSYDFYNMNTGKIVKTEERGYSVDDPKGINFLKKGYKIPIKIMGKFANNTTKDITSQIDIISEKNNAIAEFLPSDIPGKVLISVAEPNEITTAIFSYVRSYIVPPANYHWYFAFIGNR